MTDTCRRIPRADHPLSRSLIDPDALRILYRLKHDGFEAYLVGGAVRDALRGGKPKDFDIATNATPMELRRMFRNSRIIGRRFKLVHVFFGDKNIEVATLRRYDDNPVEGSSGPGRADHDVRRADHDGELDDDEDDGEDGDDADGSGHETGGSLYIDDDNNWGTVETDAQRRDFTINGLYYDIRDFTILDHVGGVGDLEAGLIRSIGDPMIRFREDPVRMLRAVKFAARFGYAFEAGTEKALRALPGEIANASRFRVTEEIFRILTQANRHRGLELLQETGLLAAIFPTWRAAVGDEGLEQVLDFFDRVEQHAQEGRFVPVELLAAGLFLPMLDTVDIEADDFQQHAGRLGDEVRSIARDMDLPKRLATSVLTLLRGQLYLMYLVSRPKSVQRYVQSPEFDWVWRLHELAFGDLESLHGIHERWLAARDQVARPFEAWVAQPDRRDIFSFRGISGGGRRHPDEPVSVIVPTGETMDAAPRRRRRGRRRR